MWTSPNSHEFILIQCIFIVLLGISYSAPPAHGDEKTLLRERSIVVPTQRGCYCLDAVWKSEEATASNKKDLFNKCATTAGLSKHQRNAEDVEKKAENQANQMMRDLQRCGKITLEYSPDNITQECFERANMAHKIHEWFMEFLAGMGDKREAFVTCMADGQSYLVKGNTGGYTGINMQTFRDDVKKYFADDAREEALSPLEVCYSQFGTFKEGDSVDIALGKFMDCLFVDCL